MNLISIEIPADTTDKIKQEFQEKYLAKFPKEAREEIVAIRGGIFRWIL